MFRVFEAPTANALWEKILRSYQSGEFSHGQESRAGITSEILHAAICIGNPRQRWVYSRRPAINIAFALAEVIWILRGRNDSAFLNFFNHALPNYAGNSPSYYGAYGHRLGKQFEFNQLECAYNALKNKPHSRQVVLQIWDPRTDFPETSGNERSTDIPCNISSLLKIRESKLEWLQVLRSNDIFRGLPYNIVQFTTLQEIIAGWLGLEVGPYHQISDSLHLYDCDANEVGFASAQPPALNSDNLAMEKRESDEMFGRLESMVEQIISPNIDVLELLKQADRFIGPNAYRNIARVLCAEGVRRRRSPKLAAEIMEGCDNLAFSEIYNTWLEQRSKPNSV